MLQGAEDGAGPSATPTAPPAVHASVAGPTSALSASREAFQARWMAVGEATRILQAETPGWRDEVAFLCRQGKPELAEAARRLQADLSGTGVGSDVVLPWATLAFFARVIDALLEEP